MSTSLPSQTRRLDEPVDLFLSRLRDCYGDNFLTTAGLLEASATRWPDREAVVDGRVRWTYVDLLNQARRVAAGMMSHFDLAPCARVGLLTKNRAEYIAAFFGITGCGLTVVPLNARLSPPELSYILANAKVQGVVVEQSLLGLIEQTASEVGFELVVISDGQTPSGFVDYAELIGEVASEDALAASDEDAVAALYFTSGTTGFPKGAQLTHLNMVASARQNAEAWCFDDPSAIHLNVAPLFHVQFQVFIPSVLHVGGSVVVADFSSVNALEIVEREQVTAMFAVPSMIFIMMAHPDAPKYDCSSLRLLEYGGSPMPTSRLADVQRLFPNAVLVQGFGQTESTGMIAATLPEETTTFVNSTGRPLSGTQIRIERDDDGAGPEKIGEIVARGPQVMSGYIDDPKSTSEALRDGWLHTGDLGYIDENGRLYVVDRLKDLIIRGGQNIYSAEVEEVLSHHRSVAEVAVVAKPHEIYLEVPIAFIVLRKSEPETGESTPLVDDGQTDDLVDELAQLCKDRLAAYKIPTEFRFVDELSKTASGKVRKVELREKYGLETGAC